MARNIEELKYIIDKKILLVGNSESLIGKNMGSMIDSFNIICRMNYGCPTGKENDLGSRTDIWISSNKKKRHYESYDLFKDVDKIIFPNPRLYEEFIPAEEVFLNDMNNYNSFIKKFGYDRPSTGCISVDYFKNTLGCKDLSLIGFTFFKDKTWYNENTINNVHRGNEEEIFIRSMGVNVL